MKRLSKILMLVLVVALTLGCVFAIASSAEDGATGVTTSTTDFTGMTGWLPWKQPNVTAGTTRVATTIDGNSYFEWNFYQGSGSARDPQIRYFPNDLVYGDYGIIEFDIATATTLPQDFGYHWSYNNRDGSEAATVSLVTVVNGQLTTGGKVIPTNPNSDWTHITIVVDGAATTMTEEVMVEGNPTTKEYTSYSETVIKVFADGKLINTMKPFGTGKLDFYNIKRAYIGTPYSMYGHAIVAGDTVAIDNWTETYCKEYLGTDEADLSQLFGENAITDLANYKGTEVLFNANGYTYPPAMGHVYVATANGNVTYKTVQAAIDAIANLEVAGDIHLINAEGVVAEDGSFIGLPSASVTVPVTIYTHGKAMAWPTVAGAVVESVIFDDVGEKVYTYAKDADSVTFEYYTTYDNYLNALYMATLDVKAGETPTAPAIESVYDKATGKVTIFKGWHYYDVDENDLGTEMPAFTEANYGTVYCAVAITETIDALFWTVNGEDVTYYGSAADFTNANLTGRTVVLGGNVTTSETLTNVKIDLNGYALTLGATLFNDGASIVYNGAATTATIYVNKPMNEAKYGAYYIGKDASGNYLSEGRITFVSNCKYSMAGGDMYISTQWYKVDMINIFNCSKRNALFGVNGNAKNTFEDCNFYDATTTYTALAFGNVVNANTYTFTNCNFYGNNFYFTEMWDKALSAAGQFIFNNCGIYTNNATYHAQNKGFYNYVFDEKTVTNIDPATADLGAIVPNGYWFKTNEAPVSTEVSFSYKATADATEATVFTTTASAKYFIEKAPVKATFNFYDVAISEVVTATPIFSQSKYLGETPTAPLLPTKKEAGKFYNVSGWIVYDAEGKEIGAIGAVTEEMNNQTYSVCPVWEEVTPAFAIVEGEDDETMYPAESLINSIVQGKTIKLYADVTVTETLYNVKVDLNGFTLASGAINLFAGSTNYVYSSAVGGKIINQNNLHSTDAGDSLYLGYIDSSNYSEYRITLVVKFIAISRNDSTYMYGCDVITTYELVPGVDKNNNAQFANSQSKGKKVVIDNCNFYCPVYTHFFSMNRYSGGFNITIKNTNFYGKGSLITKHAYNNTAVATINLENVHTYGEFQVSGVSSFVLNIDKDCTFANAPATNNIAAMPEGMEFIPANGTSTVETITYSTSLNGEALTFGGEFASRVAVGTAEEKAAAMKAIFAASFRNVNLDVNINYNLYIPAIYNVAGATEKVTINGAEYWVVTFATAPKDAYATKNVVTVTINGVACEYDASVVSYAKALMNVASESEYAVASKNVAKYVLNYIKTVAVAANAEADVTAIDAILGDFTIGEITVEGAIENVAPIAGVEGVALELDSNVGMVVKVSKDYIGTITVSIAGAETVNQEYAEAAEADRYIVIGDIEIFNFTNDVVITNGTETMTYNLATYVNNKKTDVAYATYAYAVQAKAYHVTYGAPNTID